MRQRVDWLRLRTSEERIGKAPVVRGVRAQSERPLLKVCLGISRIGFWFKVAAESEEVYHRLMSDHLSSCSLKLTTAVVGLFAGWRCVFR